MDALQYLIEHLANNGYRFFGIKDYEEWNQADGKENKKEKRFEVAVCKMSDASYSSTMSKGGNGAYGYGDTLLDATLDLLNSLTKAHKLKP